MAFQSLQLMWDVNADPRFKPYNVKSKVNILEQKEILTTNMEMHHIEVRRKFCVSARRLTPSSLSKDCIYGPSLL